MAKAPTTNLPNPSSLIVLPPRPSSSPSRVPMADEDVSGSDTDGSSITSSSDGDHEYPMELRPMTEVGVKRLCSELLAIKKASDEDFHRNVYSCYSAFVR
ncbi:hypothetical protein BHE74_00031484 [Ensete ventricosum]|nr:hypothetical protein BHE74_00031484 [Ensete ventricosum]